MMQIAARRWETATRYFEVWIYRDLLGDTILAAANGGKRSRLGMVRILAIGPVQIAKELESIEKRRLKHGYRECPAIAAGRAGPVADRREHGRVADAAKRVGDHQMLDPRRKLRSRVVKNEEVIDAGAFHQVQDRRLAG